MTRDTSTEGDVPSGFPLSRQLVEAASWRIVSELMRRHSARLFVIETHRGGGMGDELTLMERERPSWAHSLGLNRNGSAHISRFDTPDDHDDMWLSFWYELAKARAPREILIALERRCGLPSPIGPLPPSSPEVITYRVIAALVGAAAFGRERIECRNGFLDTAAGGSGRRTDWFGEFPTAQAKVGQTRHPFGDGAYSFWFVLREEEQVICLSTDGFAWNRNGSEYNLVELYRRGRRKIWSAAGSLAELVLG